MKRRKSSFAFFSKDKAPTAHSEGELSPDAVFLDKPESHIDTNVSNYAAIKNFLPVSKFET